MLNKKPISLLGITFFQGALMLGVVALLIINALLSARVVNSNYQLNLLAEKRQQLVEANKQLKTELVSVSSLNNLTTQAQLLGFTKDISYVQINPKPFTVAVLP